MANVMLPVTLSSMTSLVVGQCIFAKKDIYIYLYITYIMNIRVYITLVYSFDLSYPLVFSAPAFDTCVKGLLVQKKKPFQRIHNIRFPSLAPS